MGEARVDLADVTALADAIVATVDEFPPIPTPWGRARLGLTQEGARHVATALLVGPPRTVQTAYRHALRADMRVWREARYWWVLDCYVCGHSEAASCWRECMGLAHAHRLECAGAAPVLKGEFCG